MQGKRKNAKPNESEVFRDGKDKSKVMDSSYDDGNQINFQSSSNLNYFPVNITKKAALQQTESKPNTLVEPIEA